MTNDFENAKENFLREVTDTCLDPAKTIIAWAAKKWGVDAKVTINIDVVPMERDSSEEAK